jgi:8-oxo-dGTP diphosphatase
VSRNVPAGYDIGDFPPFAVTVDVVILSVVDGELLVLLIQRKDKPFKKAWALPGGFKRPDETLDEAARRELREETGVDAPKHLAQFGAYGDPKRDPRGNVVTVAYLAVTPEVGRIMAGTDASDARLWPVAQVLDAETLENTTKQSGGNTDRIVLAFDHRRILADAVERAAADLESSDLATAFVGPSFTLSELQRVYEAVWADELDTANFRRSLASGPDASYVEPTGALAESGDRGGRPPALFSAGGSWTSDGSPVKRPRKRGRSK